jgi:tetratricopeptide (TPR) repeat protein
MADPAFTLSQVFSRAVSAYNAGKLVEAERLCQAIIDNECDLADALHLLAIVQSSLGKKHTALASYDRLLKLRPDYAEALSDRGNTLHELKRFEEALASYDRALKQRPDYAEALFNRGDTLHELKRFEEALASYDRLLKQRPDYAEALFNRGVTLRAMKRFEEALASYEGLLKLRPDYAEALFNRGNTLHELKRFEEALASYDRALKLRPDYAEALFNRGTSLHELKRFEEALASYDRFLKLRPDYAEALSNRGNSLHELKRFEEALASYERALKLRPDYAEALTNRGNSLHELNRFEEALASYDRALNLQPHYAEALTNRGATLRAMKRFEEALASYDGALKLRPDYAEAHLNEALCRLLIADFDRGWEKYEWRWGTEQFRMSERDFVQPLWTGRDNVQGKTILLHAEQGFGDAIQFCRYVPLVAERGAGVILEVHRPLRELMTTLTGAARIVSRGDPLPDFDMHCPLLSLPLAFGTRLETIPSTTLYLRASPQALVNWDARLASRKHRARIGLAWSGNPGHLKDHNRSIRLSSLVSLLDINATFVSLQQDVRPEDATVLGNQSDLLHFGNELETFADTAALISTLDLVISVDTSVAHLAGALAKPVWVMLPFIADWRWLLDREDSPWYPTVRLFRQDETRAWDSVIARVRTALHDFLRCP